jgi:hypothetical protein
MILFPTNSGSGEMKFLLDTHVFIWADSQPQKLSEKAKACWEGQDVTAQPELRPTG